MACVDTPSSFASLAALDVPGSCDAAVPDIANWLATSSVVVCGSNVTFVSNQAQQAGGIFVAPAGPFTTSSIVADFCGATCALAGVFGASCGLPEASSSPSSPAPPRLPEAPSSPASPAPPALPVASLAQLQMALADPRRPNIEIAAGTVMHLNTTIDIRRSCTIRACVARVVKRIHILVMGPTLFLEMPPQGRARYSSDGWTVTRSSLHDRPSAMHALHQRDY